MATHPNSVVTQLASSLVRVSQEPQPGINGAAVGLVAFWLLVLGALAVWPVGRLP